MKIGWRIHMWSKIPKFFAIGINTNYLIIQCVQIKNFDTWSVFRQYSNSSALQLEADSCGVNF